MLDPKVLARHAKAIHLRGNATGKTERRVFSHRAEEGLERGHRFGPGITYPGILSLRFREPGVR
jgi:hypothetical protein